MLAWMDLEMTGLEPDRHVIVEIATLLTDDDLELIAEGPDLIVHATPEQLAEMDDFVTNMHTRSGLLDQITESTITLEEAGAQTLAFCKRTSLRPGPCRCAATRSGPIVASSPPICPKSRSSSTTARSTSPR